MRRVAVLLVGVVFALSLMSFSSVSAQKEGKKAAEKATADNKAAAEKPAAPAGPPPAPGQYKIGVVNRKSVLDGYKKVADEYKRLQGEVDVLQKDIDKLSERIEAAKKKYDAEKDTMTTAEKADREATIQSEYRQYKAELETKQADIDTKEQLLMKKVLTEINDTISKIGTNEGYHLIMDGGTRAGAVYYSPTIDISQKVIDALNSKS